MGSALSRRRAALPADGTDVQSRVLANATGEPFATTPILCHVPSFTGPDVPLPDLPNGQEVDESADTSHAADQSISVASQLLSDPTPDALETVHSELLDSQHETEDLPDEVYEEPAGTCATIPSETLRNKVWKRLKQMSSGKSGKLFFLVVVCSSLFAAFRLLPQLTRKSSDPPQFFPTSSGIVDFKRGEMTKLSLRVLEHEVAFVLYYAHWDLDSIRYKSEHEAIAKMYGQEIFFAAINCWWPEGECSQVMRLKRFPVLLAHVRNVGDVEYRGPLVPSYVIPFLDSILEPVIPIQNPGQLLDLRSRHDVSPCSLFVNLKAHVLLLLMQAVVVRYFDFRDSSQPHGYNNYLSLAVKSLAVDPWRRVQFTIVTSRKAAFKTRVTRATSLYMFMWNSSLEVGVDDNHNQNDDLLRWIHESLQEKGSIVNWITPNGVKSNLLNAVMANDPTFILFTPRSSLFGISPYFEVVSLSF